jgi:hypothetical protein
MQVIYGELQGRSNTSMTIRRTLLNALAVMGHLKAPFEELTFVCSDSTTMAAQRFGRHTNENTILCIHGWMDNCRSFHYLAPVYMSRANCQVVTFDLPGHGMSSHKSNDAPPMVQAEQSYYVSEAIHALGMPEKQRTDAVWTLARSRKYQVYTLQPSPNKFQN